MGRGATRGARLFVICLRAAAICMLLYMLGVDTCHSVVLVSLATLINGVTLTCLDSCLTLSTVLCERVL